jgi:hypothetical protein
MSIIFYALNASLCPVPTSHIKKLKRSDVATGIDGEQWIFTSRQKTETPSRIPLLPQAMDIIRKYTYDPFCSHKDVLFPVPSNQKMNAYLKEISDLCGISKAMTCHTARHTFATTITLTNLNTLFVRKLHKPFYLGVEVFLCIHTEVMIELPLFGHVRDLQETEVVVIRLWEWEHHMDKVFAQLGNVADAFARSGNADHGFGGMHRNGGYFLVLLYKIVI